ncbi:MAG: S-layer family protein [Cyanobacteria bacterium J06633_8]
MKRTAFLPGLISGLLTLGMILPASSQVTSDGSTNTTINKNGDNFNILNGIQKGNNLFHSFKEFSIPRGGAAIFNNSTDVVNIINRVTGGNISSIDGLIKASGNANLFLINPAGIIFGENAALNIGGSFFATTAESILFENGIEFSVNSLEEPPLLSINVPLGIQFGNNPGKIEVQGSGHQLIIDDSGSSFIRDARPVGLQVPDGKTLALIGGDISLQGGNLTARGGHIELGSVANSARVELIPTSDGFTNEYKDILDFGNISLEKAASVEVSGEGGGNIQIQGQKISIVEDSVVLGNTLGTENGGLVSIRGSESLTVIGNKNIPFLTGIHSLVELGGTGNGGDIAIETPQLTVVDSSIVQTSTSGEGNGGDTTINAQNLFISDSADISSDSFDSGNAGNVVVTANKLSVDNDGFISSDSFDSGNAGNVVVTANKLSVDNDGYISSDSFDSGNGGNVVVTANKLSVDNDGYISSDTFDSGNGGNVVITAEELSVNNSGFISSDTYSSGNAGDTNIEVNSLELTNGGQISSGTFDSGNSGNLKINASESISISGNKIFSNPELDDEVDVLYSGLLVSTEFESTGNGGSLIVETPNLQINDGGSITSGTLGSGNAGNITIIANNVEVSNSITDKSSIRSGIDSTVELSASGNGGNIDIVANNLRVFDGGSIAANTLGEGNAGDISINARSIDVNGDLSEQQLPSQISALSKNDFAAGSVNITTESIRIRNGAEINVSNQGLGEAGNLNLTANNLLIDSGGRIKAEVNGGQQGNINLDINELVLLQGGSSITTNATDASQGGNIIIDSAVIAGFENSDIIANAVDGDGGNIDITTQGIFGLKFRQQSTDESDISASSQFGVNGTVEINNFGIDPASGLVELPVDLINPSQKVKKGCSNQGKNKFVVIGRGGIPHNPTQWLNSISTWSEPFNFVKHPQQSTNTVKTTQILNQPHIIEANGFIRNQKGEIELVALKNISHTTTSALDCSGYNIS